MVPLRQLCCAYLTAGNSPVRKCKRCKVEMQPFQRRLIKYAYIKFYTTRTRNVPNLCCVGSTGTETSPTAQRSWHLARIISYAQYVGSTNRRNNMQGGVKSRGNASVFEGYEGYVIKYVAVAATMASAFGAACGAA